MYTKIFAQIFDGTLCSKGPWQALVTFEQFLILADQDGTVDMTADAVSRRTTIPLDIIEMGIAALLEPDPQSRNPASEGRRLVPLSAERNWGWTIVNYAIYRNIRDDEERRESQRKWDRENRPTRSDRTRQNPTRPDTSRRNPTNPTHTDTEAKAVKPLARDFERFWNAYPKKQGKADALKAFKHLSPSRELLETMLTAVAACANSADWKKERGKFIPYAKTWLHGKRWEDEIKPSERIWEEHTGPGAPV